jgi:AcrR family transcriptional regulator
VGLREQNAARTRDQILDAAIPLFATRGYDTTRMEDVAEAADVSASTLYRYYPTKELLVLEPIAFHGQMAKALGERPADEPLGESLGHALLAMLTTPRGDDDRLKLIGEIVAAAPDLQNRVRDVYLIEEAELERAIAERLGRPEVDLHCRLSARIMTTVLEIATRPDGDVHRTMAEAIDFARTTLRAMGEDPPTIPTLA